MEHLDSRESLNPEVPGVELIPLVDRLIAAETMLGNLYRQLSDAEREKVAALGDLRRFWLKVKVQSLEDEPGVAPVENIKV